MGVIRLFTAPFVALCLTWRSKEMSFKMPCRQAGDYKTGAATNSLADQCGAGSQSLLSHICFIVTIVNFRLRGTPLYALINASLIDFTNF